MTSSGEARYLPIIQLPSPAAERSDSVFAALEKRKTTREIAATPLPMQVLSNLLWAAYVRAVHDDLRNLGLEVLESGAATQRRSRGRSS